MASAIPLFLYEGGTRGAFIGPVLAPPFAHAHLGGAETDKLVEDRLLAVAGSKYPAKALDMLPGAGASGDHDAHAGLRDVDALVEDFASYEGGVFAAAEAVEESVYDALFAGETMTGRAGNILEAAPVDTIVSLIEKYHEK